MALSGSIYQAVGSHWYLKIEWSASQNKTSNYSYVNAYLYWGCDSYGHVNSSATKDCAMQHDNGSWYSKSAGGMAALNDGQKKEINHISFRVNHDSNGNASFSLDAYFDAEVTLSGTYYSRIDMAQKSWSLNNIPQNNVMVCNSSNNWVKSQPVKVWDGNSWNSAQNIYVWNGSSWVDT